MLFINFRDRPNLKVTSIPWSRAGLECHMTLKSLQFEDQGRSNKQGTRLICNRVDIAEIGLGRKAKQKKVKYPQRGKLT